MCTVTIVPLAKPVSSPGSEAMRWRMACSRDELHGRPAALPPEKRSAENGLSYVMPIDPGSGGTWVAVNEAGLALTLLNLNLSQPPTDRTLSRGGVIPILAGCGDVAEAVAECAHVECTQMMPFRLVLCDGGKIAMWRSTQPSSQIDVMPMRDAPFFFTSSGLGDHLVEAPRRAVFDDWFKEQGDALPWDRQDALHRHRWPDRPELSICMSRADARTVSYTTVEVDAHAARMVYHPDRPDHDAADVQITLDRRVRP